MGIIATTSIPYFRRVWILLPYPRDNLGLSAYSRLRPRMGEGGVIATTANPPLLPKVVEVLSRPRFNLLFLISFIYIFHFKEMNKISLYNEVSGYSKNKISSPSQVTVSAIFEPVSRKCL